MISRNGCKSKFFSDDFKQILENLEKKKNPRYFKLIDITKELITPYIKTPKDKVNKYSVLLRSTYLNEPLFHRIIEMQNYKKNFQKQQERTKNILNLVNKLQPIE